MWVGLQVSTDGLGDEVSIIHQLFFPREEPLNKESLADAAQGNLEWSGVPPKQGPAVPPLFESHQAEPLNSLGTGFCFSLVLVSLCPEPQMLRSQGAHE